MSNHSPKRSQRKAGASSESGIEGVVVRSTGSWYRVRTLAGEEMDCRMRGNLRIRGIKTTNPVAVGDHVRLEIGDPDTMITEVMERRNYVLRKSVNLSRRAHILCANIDQALILFTLDHPVTTLGYVDRLLVTCQAYHIPAILVFNKVDLLDEALRAKLADYRQTYEGIGYQTIALSATDPQYGETVRNLLGGKVSFLVGRSGTGKSTLVNLVQPGMRIKVGQVSDFSGRGIHTTTFAEMFPLDIGGDIIDSPGFKEMVIFDLTSAELSHYFPEMRPYLSECRFANCIHHHEPGCAVKAAVTEGKIPESRYHTYLGMLAEIDVPGW
jgi:ribosome biogenesis GTPase / thiamine phosphate phosphatase